MRFRAVAGLGLVLFASGSQAADGELHTFHCLDGCPLGAPATNDVVVREIYTLSSNDVTKMADWVAYRITPETVAASRAIRNYRRDPAMDPSETLDESHYDGAPADLHIDHGHQAPLAAFSGTQQWDDTNYNSNMTPQASALNQGPWQRLEGRERDLVVGRAVYVITGPLFERFMKPMPAAPELHRVPSGYWKIIALADGRMSAFIMDQNTARNADYCTLRTTLMHVQLRSRLLFFPMRHIINPGNLDTELGCTAPAPAPPPPSEIVTR
jgi:endonuclease G, mitochondrial